VQRDAVPTPLRGYDTDHAALPRSLLVLTHSVTRECFMHGMHFDAPQQMKVGY
jgi:hypothetical protein